MSGEVLHNAAGEMTVDARPVEEDVRAALEAEARESLRDEAYETQLAQWVEEAGVTYHREALENNA